MHFTKLAMFLLLAMCVLHGAELNAQTCASPLALVAPPAAPAATGNTCGNPDSIQTFCGTYQSLDHPDAVYRLDLGVTGRSFSQLSILAGGGSPTFNPVVVIYSGDCASATGCIVMANVSSSPVDTSPSVLPAGHYFLVVTADESDPAGACGEYTVQANGVLPVQLQSFRVE